MPENKRCSVLIASALGADMKAPPQDQDMGITELQKPGIYSRRPRWEVAAHLMVRKHLQCPTVLPCQLRAVSRVCLAYRTGLLGSFFKSFLTSFLALNGFEDCCSNIAFFNLLSFLRSNLHRRMA